MGCCWAMESHLGWVADLLLWWHRAGVWQGQHRSLDEGQGHSVPWHCMEWNSSLGSIASAWWCCRSVGGHEVLHGELTDLSFAFLFLFVLVFISIHRSCFTSSTLSHPTCRQWANGCVVLSCCRVTPPPPPQVTLSKKKKKKSRLLSFYFSV